MYSVLFHITLRGYRTGQMENTFVLAVGIKSYMLALTNDVLNGYG